MSITSFFTGLSGVNAGIRRVEVAADNKARANVPNAERNRVIEETQKHGGVSSKVMPVKRREQGAGEGPDDGVLTSNIDYAEETVQEIIGTAQTEANLRTLKITQELEESIIDLKV